MPGTTRHTHRLREISVQAMVEGSVRARLGRAMNTRTTISAQAMDLKVDDEVDIYRTPATKDAAGWFGPAEVIDVTRATRGIVSVRYLSRVLEVQLSHVRKHLYFFSLLTSQTQMMSVHTNVWDHIRLTIDQMPANQLIHVGHIRTAKGWILSQGNRRLLGLMSAIRFFAENHLCLDDVVSARVGHGPRLLPGVQGY